MSFWRWHRDSRSQLSEPRSLPLIRCNPPPQKKQKKRSSNLCTGRRAPKMLHFRDQRLNIRDKDGLMSKEEILPKLLCAWAKTSDKSDGFFNLLLLLLSLPPSQSVLSQPPSLQLPGMRSPTSCCFPSRRSSARWRGQEKLAQMMKAILTENMLFNRDRTLLTGN